MLNKANKIMEQRIAMINEAREVLLVLGAEEAPVVTNSVVINKGKIVEIQTVKEVKVTNNEELDRLRKENDKHMRIINELYATIDDYQLRMNCLEDEIHFRDGQILGYQNQIKQLEDKIAELQGALNAKKLVKKVKPMEEILKEEFKQQQAINEEQQTINEEDEVLKQLYAQLQMLNEKMENARYKDKVQFAINKITKQIEERKQQLMTETDTINIQVTDTYHHDLQGTVTIDEKEYFFKATNTHHMPIVYGAMNMDIIDKAKHLINTRVKAMNIPFSFAPQGTEFDEVVYDFERGIVVWKTIEGQFKGYTNDYIFAWDTKHNVPMRKLFKNALEDKKTLYKPMNGSNGSKKQKEEGIRIMTLIHDIFDAQETNEIVVNTQEENVNNTNEEAVSDALFGVDDME